MSGFAWLDDKWDDPDWSGDDSLMAKVDGEWVLMTKHMYDTPIKAKARKRYWSIKK